MTFKEAVKGFTRFGRTLYKSKEKQENIMVKEALAQLRAMTDDEYCGATLKMIYKGDGIFDIEWRLYVHNYGASYGQSFEEAMLGIRQMLFNGRKDG